MSPGLPPPATHRKRAGSKQQNLQTLFRSRYALTFARAEALRVPALARGNVRVTGSIVNAAPVGSGEIRLAADVRGIDVGDNGIGQVIVLDGASVSGSAVTLQGADVDIGVTSANVAAGSAVFIRTSI